MEKPELEVSEYECSKCGWKFQVAGEFHGQHGRADANPSEPKICDELAVKVE